MPRVRFYQGTAGQEGNSGMLIEPLAGPFDGEITKITRVAITAPDGTEVTIPRERWGELLQMLSLTETRVPFVVRSDPNAI